MVATVNQFLDVTLSLSDLLGVKFISGQNLDQYYIGKVVQRAFQLQSFGRMQEFSWLVALLICLREDLALLAKNKPNLHRNFRKHLISPNIATYAGARTEVYLIGKLLRAGIPFEKQESPDFIVRGFSKPVYLECTSCHFSELGDRPDFVYKFESSIRSKTRKKYNKENLILITDGTNVFHHGTPWRRESSGFSNFRNRIVSCLSRSDFDSLILLCFLIDSAQDRFGYTYHRFGRSALSAPLRDFLATVFPIQREKAFKFQVPRFA